MTDQRDPRDRRIADSINDLAEEEARLYARAGDGSGLSEGEQSRLRQIRVELDQCEDLLRQREARRAFGEDPDAARVRSPEVVEHYQQ
jgi:hypothetical protein